MIMYCNGAKANCRGVRKGSWTEEEDNILRSCIEKYGEGNWHRVPLRAGLNRCRKSCRLRWMNYLKPNIKRGQFSEDEVDLIIRLHKLLGNRWSLIAGRIPGRTANDVKNYWNTHLRRKFSPRPPKYANILHNNIPIINNNLKQTHKNKESFLTTSKSIFLQPQVVVIRPQPCTFPVMITMPGSVTSGWANRPGNIPIEKPRGCNNDNDDDDDDGDYVSEKWWENLVKMYEKEENEEGADQEQLDEPKDGLVSDNNHPGGLNIWPPPFNEVSINVIEEHNIWEDHELRNFDINVWE